MVERRDGPSWLRDDDDDDDKRPIVKIQHLHVMFTVTAEMLPSKNYYFSQVHNNSKA